MGEARLQVAMRHIARQEALIGKQRSIIKALRAAEQPTDLATETLQAMRRVLAVLQSEVERLSHSS